MFSRMSLVRTCGLALVVSLVAMAGCSKKEDAKPTADAKPDVAKPDTEDAKRSGEVAAKLAKADLVDGKSDKIVTRCPSCSLRMDGTADHALKALDYTLYFCTEGCAKGFGENMTESILAMKTPDE